jgi:hypothetical protein
MAFTRDDIRASIERAGDAHWDALVRHHTDVYPESNPPPEMSVEPKPTG